MSIEFSKTDHVKRLLQSKKTILENVQPGCTKRVETLDVVINKPFKNVAKEKFERHLGEKLDDFVDGNLTIFNSKALKTKWVGNVKEWICRSKDMFIC